MDTETFLTVARQAASRYPRSIREDLVQEGVMRILKDLPRHDPTKSSLKTFCFAAARFAMIDYIRSQFRRKVKYEPLFDEHHIPEFDEVEYKDLLEQLAPIDRELIELGHEIPEHRRAVATNNITADDVINCDIMTPSMKEVAFRFYVRGEIIEKGQLKRLYRANARIRVWKQARQGS